MCFRNIFLLAILLFTNLVVIARSKETNVWKEFVEDVIQTNDIKVLSKCMIQLHVGLEFASEMLDLIRFLQTASNK